MTEEQKKQTNSNISQSGVSQSGVSQSGLSQLEMDTMCKTVMVSASVSDDKLIEEEQFSAFVLIAGPDSMMGRYWKIDKKTLSVGRSRDCGLCIPEPSVSKSHFFLRVSGDNRISIIDAHSTNGTFVNNVVLSPSEEIVLCDNDLIEFGNISLKFLDKGNPEIAAVADNFKRSFTDHLTGAGNRFLLNIRAPEMFLMSRRHGRPLSVIIFDIDHFKKINDEYGHLAGDFILKNITSLGRSCFRSNDLFVRSGGEEFCIFVHSSAKAARRSIELVRQKIQEYQFLYKKKQISVTISAGLAIYGAMDKNWKEIYQRADEALYKAKESGRNQVCAA